MKLVGRNLRFRYPEKERWVLPGIGMEVAAGECVLLLGPSGCGKSTLGACLKTLIPETIEGEFSGETVIEDGSSRITSVFRRVGMVFQDPETQAVMPRVDEDVAFGLENIGLPSDEMPARVAESIALVGLEEKQRAFVHHLSGGEMQRLALAGVLAMRPDFLVLDEPTAQLDPQAARDFFDTISELKQSLKLGMLLIEHRIDAAMDIVDRVVIMGNDGEILSHGDPEKVFYEQSKLLEKLGVWQPAVTEVFRSLAGQVDRRHPVRVNHAIEILKNSFPAAKQLAAVGSRKEERPLSVAKVESGQCRVDPPVVRAAGLCFAYTRNMPVLKDVGIELYPGEMAALCGRNGSGKSTLARILVGLLKPASGRVEICGRSVRRISQREIASQVGYVFQNPEHQFVTQRVEDEIRFSLNRILGTEKAQRKTDELLEEFGLVSLREANPFELSQGQKRRLSVATMLGLGQRLLILDEPTFGQDAATTVSLMAILKEVQRSGTAVLMITHDMELVLRHAARLLVLQGGSMLFDGDPFAVLDRADLLESAHLVVPARAELGAAVGNSKWFYRNLPYGPDASLTSEECASKHAADGKVRD